MSAMLVNNAQPSLNPPSRKPLPAGRSPASNTLVAQYASERSHSRSRTNSSCAIPWERDDSSPPPPLPIARTPPTMAAPSNPQHDVQRQLPHHPVPSRRTLSNATSSTSSTGTANGALHRTTIDSASAAPPGVRRSTSSRSNASSIPPTSYVALMRKQKGTVWCDRAQNEDPRILAAQRQAKMRAAAEVAGGHNYAAYARTSTSSAGGVVGGVRSKIRHHGAPKASAYNAAALGGAGVPMRLSASEVDDGDDSGDDDVGSTHRPHAVSATSRRSSLGSGRRGQTYLSSPPAAGLHRPHSNGSTPPGISPVDSMDDVPEEDPPTMGTDDRVPYADEMGNDRHFTAQPSSSSAAELEQSFGRVGGLPQRRNPDRNPTQLTSTQDDLRRRGSVDDRTMTMSAGRLFVANPDLSD